jgi:acetoin utilization deacetylase AcuC-like enzyme
MATITPTMVSSRPEFVVVVAGVDVGSVDAGTGFAFSITNTAVV